ncbi:MAG: family 10 glycosylhydrolase [Elainellaceae cyanobacterium]
MVNTGIRFNGGRCGANLRQAVLLSAFGPLVVATGLLGPCVLGSFGPSLARAQSNAIQPQAHRPIFVLAPPAEAPLSESEIADRFAAAGLDYQFVRWSDLGGMEHLNAPYLTSSSSNDTHTRPSTPVLFLPYAESISPQQLATLRQFLEQGGRLVTGGRVGLASSDEIQQELRSLLGAYWAFPLLQPAQIDAAAERIPNINTAIMGGVVVPGQATSQVIATWREDEASASLHDSPAVVRTGSVLFLGWSWGEATNPQMDSAWLQAAVLQYDDNFAVGGSLRHPDRVIADAGAAQAAPDALPIWPREANLMTQELEGLIGRFERALLLAESTAPTINVQSSNSVLVAAAEQVPLAESEEAWRRFSEGPSVASGDQPAASITARKYSILEQAQQTLDNFPLLVAQQNYSTARRNWFEARRLLWDNFPNDRPVVQPEIRAIWLDRGTIVNAGSHQALAELFDQLAHAGINTVFFETINAGYPIYPSRIAPEQNPLIPEDWDPLASAVELAHDRDMELHAWVWAFAAGNQRHNTLVDQPWNYLGPVLDHHPDWANLDHRGSPIPQGQTKPFLDPANPQVRRYLLGLFNEILTQYDVDGLQLDYIRYPFQDPSAGRSYGYGTASRQQFKALTGVDPADISPSDRRLWEQWTDFRVDQIDSFVSSVSRLVRRRRPDAILSAAVFPMAEHERRHKIQQLWERWARDGEVDIIATMSYAIDTPQLEALVNPWLNDSLAPALVLPAIRLLNLPNTLALDQIQALRDLPTEGYALFAAENLHENVTLQQVFQRTQGSAAATAIPYREPFKAAAERYAILQREWDVALSNGRLYVSEEQQRQLMERAIALGDHMERLADEPSPKQVRQAKRQLQQFRQEFGQWMTLQAINRRYRVQTWENRLAAIDNLLAYGEERLDDR